MRTTHVKQKDKVERSIHRVSILCSPLGMAPSASKTILGHYSLHHNRHFITRTGNIKGFSSISFQPSPFAMKTLPFGHASHLIRETQMNPYEVNSDPLSHSSHLCRRSSSLGLGASGLGGLVSLDGPLALADGGSAGDGVLAEVGAVVTLGGGADDGSVGPVCC
jgi:hypothetical protein